MPRSPRQSQSPRPSAIAPPRPRPPSLRAAALLAATVGMGCALLTALVVVRWHPLLTVDGDVSRATHHWAVHDHALTHIFRVLTDWVWDPLTMRLVSAVAVVWLVWRHAAWWTALWLAVTVGLAAVVQQSLKSAVDRPRPVWPDPVDSAGYAAFPSGHAMTATVVCGLLLWLLHRFGAGRARRRTAVAAAVVSVVGVGLTRVWLGVHWPSDVLGGWLYGALVAALAVAAYEWPRPRHTDTAPHRPG
ncbi:phosphatase PAP2 family protein [Streptomyces sp. NPDC050743]|uniref:phosphatase PAP2 family protein n=1 Tax=Streptomyces sp. NPDC050743 TaxID=3365634 RepID=UPI0037AD8A27